MKIKTLLGAQAKPLDVRDLDYSVLGGSDSLPESYTNQNPCFRHDQAGTPTCGAHAGVHAKQFLDFPDTGVQKYSPEYLWKKIKSIDSWRPEEGTDIRAICRALKSFGICDFDLLPSDWKKPIAEYSTDDTTKEMSDNAQPRVVKTYAFMGGNRELIKRAIFDTGCAILLLRFDEKDYFRKKTITTNGAMTLGHFVVAYGWDGDDIKILCSAHGSNANPLKVLKPSFVISDSATLTDILDSEVRALIQKRELLQKVVQLWQTLLGLLKK